MDKARIRRDIVLDQMARYDYITQAQADAAKGCTRSKAWTRDTMALSVILPLFNHAQFVGKAISEGTPWIPPESPTQEGLEGTGGGSTPGEDH